MPKMLGKDLVIKFKTNSNPLFLDCIIFIAVKSLDKDLHAIELYLQRVTPTGHHTLRLKEVRDVDASVVDSILETWVKNLYMTKWEVLHES